MSKTLCKLKKSRKSSKNSLPGDGLQAMYICRKCDRVAGAKKKLCKSRKLAIND